MVMDECLTHAHSLETSISCSKNAPSLIYGLQNKFRVFIVRMKRKTQFNYSRLINQNGMCQMSYTICLHSLIIYCVCLLMNLFFYVIRVYIFLWAIGDCTKTPREIIIEYNRQHKNLLYTHCELAKMIQLRKLNVRRSGRKNSWKRFMADDEGEKKYLFIFMLSDNANLSTVFIFI